MTANQRRAKIERILATQSAPISATTLAGQLGVSRQIVVGDIALLRASGATIDATPRGYRLSAAPSFGYQGMIACQHGMGDDLERELFLVVDHGGIVEDVAVENPLYGELRAKLHITNRYEASEFCKRAAVEPNSLLSTLTGGVHLHTIYCADAETFARIEAALAEAGILFKL